MKINAGVWVDHREAVIVLMSDDAETTTRVLSNVQKQHAQEVPPDDIRERVHTEHLSRYYDEIIARVNAAGAVLIFGPGEAKGELKKRFESSKSENRVISVETADNMSDGQAAAQVRRHFYLDKVS